MPCRVLQGRIRHHTETHARKEVVIELVINGEPRSFPAPLTLAQLIETLDLAGKRIAIEKNGEIIPRSQHAERALQLSFDGTCCLTWTGLAKNETGIGPGIYAYIITQPTRGKVTGT